MPPENHTDPTRFNLMVSDLKRTTFRTWNVTPEDHPVFPRTYGMEEQAGNGRAMERLLAEADRRSGKEEFDRGGAERLKTVVRRFLARTFDLSGFHGHGRFFDSCWKCSLQFIQDARRFDPSISSEDIGQALRNLLIVNSIQAYLGMEITVGPSAFAYSLLYPYTDNHLDDNSVSAAEKRHFLADVQKLLQGERASPSKPLVRKVADLISMIESEYPRASFPDVYGSLLAIHRAQEKSLLEHHGPDDEDILAISIEKGGTSVLADACLVTGTVPAGTAGFMFAYGAALQLIDDLQDISEDRRNSHSTLFARQSSQEALEVTTNHLFNFTGRVLKQAERFPCGEAKALADFSGKSCFLLMFEAVARAKELYSGPYVESLERGSQLGFHYLGTLRDRLEAKYLAPPATRSAERPLERAMRLFL